MDCLSSCGVNYSVDDIIKKLLAAEQIALTAESVTRNIDASARSAYTLLVLHTS